MGRKSSGKRCPECGRFRHSAKEGYGVYVDSKGYLRISVGPLRGVRVHTLVMEAKLGRKLKPDEQTHHVDGNKLNCAPENLDVLGIKEHGAVSSRQAHYFKTNDIKLKSEWDEFFAEENRAGEGTVPF